MNIVIVGAGALGSLFAARLSQTEETVVLFDHNTIRAKALNNCITLVENEQETTCTLPITAQQSCLKKARAVLLCTKSGDVEQALSIIKKEAKEQPIILGFQNGIHHISAIAKMQYGGFAVTAQGATLLKPGYVRHGGIGSTMIGYLSQNSESLRPIAQRLSSANIPTSVTNNIKSKLWQKLLINVGINGLTVLYDCPNGELLHIPEARERLIRLVSEGTTVARTVDVKTSEDLVRRCLDVCNATASNISSMLQDFRNHKKSEIMAINGALVQEAKKVDIATPENDLLIQQVLEKWHGS